VYQSPLLLCNGQLLCGFNVPIKGLRNTTDRQRHWDYATKLARWQHFAVGRGARFAVPGTTRFKLFWHTTLRAPGFVLLQCIIRSIKMAFYAFMLFCVKKFSLVFIVDEHCITRNLAIANRSRSASHNSRSDRPSNTTVEKNCSHVTSDRCSWLCRLCRIFDMHNETVFSTENNSQRSLSFRKNSWNDLEGRWRSRAMAQFNRLHITFC